MMMTTVTEENFNQEVLASSVPVFVHFRAPWCSVCRLMTPILTSVQSEWPTPVKLFEVNADENFKLANQYQLKTLPTFLYIDQGKVLHRIEGIADRNAFRTRLKAIAYRCQLEDAFVTTSA